MTDDDDTPGAGANRLETDPSRRNFFKKLTLSLYGLVSFLAAVPLFSFFISPALRKSEEEWVELGSVEKFTGKKPVRVEYEKVVKDGWMNRRMPKTAWVYTTAGSPVAISPVCTHLGCTVNFDDNSDKFICPCHGGTYGRDGKVVAGPPPEPLRRHRVRIEGGMLLIGGTVNDKERSELA